MEMINITNSACVGFFGTGAAFDGRSLNDIRRKNNFKAVLNEHKSEQGDR